ncbi:hypothetical protein AYK26_07250 [Euryarchaeota archaeon SM23-78]|nr:MAG: hypothetical protein AYK26_07250 [Euryarchaeota archaeon SM23-78]
MRTGNTIFRSRTTLIYSSLTNKGDKTPNPASFGASSQPVNILFFLLIFILVSASPVSAAWADSDFDKCMNITITNSGSKTLIDFPAYINLTYDNDMLPDFKDIRFYNASCGNGGNLLAYEIENYTTSTRAHTWARIPSLPSTGRTISIYYKNNTAISSGENATGVWDNNYVGVWHMTEANATDSTSNGFNATDVKEPSTTEGWISLGVELDQNESFNITNQTEDVIKQNGTISFWYKETDNMTQWDRFYATENASKFAMAKYNSTQIIPTINTEDQYHDITIDLWDDSFHYVVLTWTTESPYGKTRTFIDGEPADNADKWGSWPGLSAENFYIGGHRNESSCEGVIDEWRISSINRTPNWINMSYLIMANQSDYVSYGSEEARPGTWANDDLDRCMNITITNSGSENLYNFPAYINLTYAIMEEHH